MQQRLMLPRWAPPGIRIVLHWNVASLYSPSFTFPPTPSTPSYPLLYEGKPGQQIFKLLNMLTVELLISDCNRYFNSALSLCACKQKDLSAGLVDFIDWSQLSDCSKPPIDILITRCSI